MVKVSDKMNEAEEMAEGEAKEMAKRRTKSRLRYLEALQELGGLGSVSLTLVDSDGRHEGKEVAAVAGDSSGVAVRELQTGLGRVGMALVRSEDLRRVTVEIKVESSSSTHDEACKDG